MAGIIFLLTALGWSLLNSIWQLAVVWTAYYTLTAGNKRISAAGKHNLALLFVSTGSGWMVCSFFQLLNDQSGLVVPGFLPVSRQINGWIPFISCIYLLILIVRFMKYGFQYVQTRKNKFGKSTSPLLQSFVDRQAQLLGITKRVRVYLSDLAETAETSGCLKPLILLPVNLLTRLSPEQLEAILIHELFHIRRNDYLINICISCFHSILFFNPFAGLFCKEISRERENACDDEVIERGYSPLIYAEALFCLEKFRQVHPGFSIAADGNKPWLLMERIRRVVGKPSLKKNRFSPFLCFSVAVSIGLFGLQQKTPFLEITTENLTAPSVQIPTLPIHYEWTGIKVNKPEKKTRQASPVNHKWAIRKTKMPVLPVISPDPEPAEDESIPDKTFFADNNIVRNFSNQQATGPDVESIQPGPGTPYVPSVALSYENQTAFTRADSIRDIAIQHWIQGIRRESHILATTHLKALQKESAKNRKQLKKLEIKNQQLILLHQRNIRPLLENIRQQLQVKMNEIDQMKLQILMTDQEIIHI